MKRIKSIALSVGLLSCISEAQASNAWDPWSDLAKLKPNASELQQKRSQRAPGGNISYSIQRVSEGKGIAVNIDEYVVEITTLPTGKNKRQFYRYVRINLNNFLDQSISPFLPESASDKDDWGSQMKALLGTVMRFEINAMPVLPADTAAVVVSRSTDFSWTFSPIEDSAFTGDFGTHPVAGNRQFGLREKGGKYEFYTRAFDRVFPFHVSQAEKDAFEGADKLWRSLQKNLVNYINNNGGSARALEPNVPGGNDPTKKPQYKDVCKDSSLGLSC